MKTRIYEDLAHLFPLWRETTLQKKGTNKRETEFIVSVLKKSPVKIKKVIDLGGGVGTHSALLLKQGYDVALFDQSKKALEIAKRNSPKLRVIRGSFEKINIKESYDAAICMWSTLSYVLTEKGRAHFYKWQREHVKHLIILDEANFYRYQKSFKKVYVGENSDYKLTVFRDWTLTRSNLKKTKFVYELYDKKTKKFKTIRDAENEQYVTIDNLKEYLGKDWKLAYLLGDHSLKKKYAKDSPRIITIFERKN